jgi:hypothetical protein
MARGEDRQQCQTTPLYRSSGQRTCGPFDGRTS